MAETVITNARIVLADAVLDGTLVTRHDRIVEVQPGRSHVPGALDCDGDHLIPGIVDVHTDNLERQVQPRSNARWPSRSALLAHDGQCAAAGVTTVLDALCLGDNGTDESRMQTTRDGIADLTAMAGTGLLRSDHFLHLRCELPAPDLLETIERVAEHPLVRMVSLMDHTPGIGQHANLDRYRAQLRRDGLDDAGAARHIERMASMRARMRGPNRRALLDRIARHAVAIASHDDETEAEVAENASDGITIAEFPVSLQAAVAARRHGMRVIAGAPNLVRGGSHSGNVAVADLLRAEAVDAFASDYVPAALIEAAFLAARSGGIDLPRAVGMVTTMPGAIAGLPDRGRIAPGLRADLVRVRLHEELPVVRAVWRAGERAA